MLISVNNMPPMDLTIVLGMSRQFPNALGRILQGNSQETQSKPQTVSPLLFKKQGKNY